MQCRERFVWMHVAVWTSARQRLMQISTLCNPSYRHMSLPLSSPSRPRAEPPQHSTSSRLLIDSCEGMYEKTVQVLMTCGVKKEAMCTREFAQREVYRRFATALRAIIIPHRVRTEKMSCAYATRTCLHKPSLPLCPIHIPGQPWLDRFREERRSLCWQLNDGRAVPRRRPLCDHRPWAARWFRELGSLSWIPPWMRPCSCFWTWSWSSRLG